MQTLSLTVLRDDVQDFLSYVNGYYRLQRVRSAGDDYDDDDDDADGLVIITSDQQASSCSENGAIILCPLSALSLTITSLPVDCRRPSLSCRRTWNDLPRHVTSASSLPVFRSRLKTHFFRRNLFIAQDVTLAIIDTLVVHFYFTIYVTGFRSPGQ